MKTKIRRIAIAILIALIGLFILIRTGAEKPELPAEFLSSREAAARISDIIVLLTDETNKKIQAVNLSDLNNRPEEALALIQEARTTNHEAYKKAFELTEELQTLTESLAKIKSPEQVRLAYEAVAIELSLASEFISYTQSLNNFFDSLSRAVSSNGLADRELTQNYLKEVNVKADAINNLNQKFIAKISEFDKTF
jgi:hypothetical protein